jgi:hypothetical protein
MLLNCLIFSDVLHKTANTHFLLVTVKQIYDAGI